jgi:hypothetical protein
MSACWPSIEPAIDSPRVHVYSAPITASPVKTSYFVPLLGVLSLAAAACDPAGDSAAVPDAGTDPGEGCNVRYADLDGDRKGDPSSWTTACAPGPGWVANSDDCDDTNPYVNADEAEICDGVDNDCRATTDEDDACAELGCKPVVNPTTGTSYLFCAAPGERDAALARDVCQDHGFRFAQIEDRAEDEFLVAQSRQFFDPSAKPIVWLGGGYTNGVWRWADGTQFWPDPRRGDTVPYASWLEGEPRLRPGAVCLALAATSEPGWRAVPCVPALTVLCERDPADDVSAPPGDVPVPGQGCEVRYRDLDQDGAGDRSSWTTDCEPGPDWVDTDDDCDDGNPHRNPSATEICDGVDNDCSDTTSDDDACARYGCRRELNSGTGERYLFCTTSVMWSSAQEVCKEEDSHLAIIDSEGENTFLSRTGKSIQPGGSWWIGASDTGEEGVWTWVNGTQFWNGNNGGPVPGRYNDWADTNPNDDGDEDCGQLYDDGYWNDNKCTLSLSFICEK